LQAIRYVTFGLESYRPFLKRLADSSGIEINADGEVGVSLGVSSKLDLLLPYVLSSSCDRAVSSAFS
jgi:hypothetical protein